MSNLIKTCLYFFIRQLAIVLIFTIPFFRCSTEQHNFTSNIYHNLTAHYNGHYYAQEHTNEVEQTIKNMTDEDPAEILRIFPSIDSVKAKSYSKQTEEIIKMASISIQRHPNSKWVYKNYLLVGLARLYASDFQNAILTFKFVNTKSPSPHTRQSALIYLLRTFLEQNDFERADETLRFLEKEKLNTLNTKNFYLQKSYYYQLRNDYPSMVDNLTLASPLLTRKDGKGRIYFIIGQVYQKLGKNDRAHHFYKKCLATHPEYEIEFFARLNIIQVTNVQDSKDVEKIYKVYTKLLADTKNKEFKDRIYFEWGEFELKQKDTKAALTKFKLAIHAGKNTRLQSQSYLRVAELNFDSLKNYKQAKFYYDSAVTLLPNDFKNYPLLKKRKDILEKLVTYTETIILNDSLLYLATLDSATLKKQLDSTFAAHDKKMTATKKKKKRLNNFSANGLDNNNNFFGTSTNNTTSDWYFNNTALIADGQNEFQRLWGNIPLEDNWRRSSKLSTTTDLPSPLSTEEAQKTVNSTTNPTSEKVDRAATLMTQLPKTEAQKAEALAKIEEAYFKLGDIYYLNLDERKNAIESYLQILKRFPNSLYTPEVLYKLYLINLEIDPTHSTQYADMLKSNYPQSVFAKLLVNPNYLAEISALEEKQKLIYKTAYTHFEQNNLRACKDKLNQAIQLGETDFTPQLKLLEVMLTGKTEDITRYQYELESYIKKYPTATTTAYAEQLLTSSREVANEKERMRGIQYLKNLNEPHYFVTVYNQANHITNAVVDAIEKFNTTNWGTQKLTVNNLVFNNEKTLTMVVEIPNRNLALSYFDQFLDQLSKTKSFSNNKFYTFVISKRNFQTFYRTKALDEYLTFFQRNYQK